MTAILSATGITAKHGRNTVLHNVDLSLKAGEIVTIVGPNGSGKSTLLRVLIGALKPTKGKVTRKDGSTFNFDALCRIDTANEVEYFMNGGILHYVLRKLAA